MSYQIRYSKIGASFLQYNYKYDLPAGFSKTGEVVVKKLLADHNRRILEEGSSFSGKIDASGDIYFFIFSDSAAFFRVTYQNSGGVISSAMKGMYFEKAFLPTMWLFIDKFLVLLVLKEFDSVSQDHISISELDDILHGRKIENLQINPDGRVKPYSFAIAEDDPKIDNVVFYPNTPPRADKLVKTKMRWSLETVLGAISTEPNDGDEYRGVIIERNPGSKSMLWARNSQEPAFCIRIGSGEESEGVTALSSIEDNKPVVFSEVENQIKSAITGGMRPEGRERTCAICMDK